MLFTTPYQDSRHTSLASKYTALFGLALRFADPAIVVLAGVVAYLLRFHTLDMPLPYARALSRGLIFGTFIFGISPLYRSWRGRGLASELMTMFGAYLALFIVGALYINAMKFSDDLSRLWRGYWFVALVLGGTGLRVVIRGAAAFTRRRGIDVRTAVVIGSNRDAARIVNTLQGQPWIGIRPIGRFEAGAHSSARHDLPCLGNVEALAAYVESHHVDQVWIALPMSAQDEIARILEALSHSTATIKFVPDLFGMQLLNHSVEQMAGMPVINLQKTPFVAERRVIKALEDRLLSGLILVAISPLMLIIAVAVKLSSPGPVFYRQERVSWNNRRFMMLKFRSMPINAEAGTGAVWAAAGESRATRVGAFLRRTSLDELPQFINVMRGEMSIVGPRPERPVFVDKFKHEVPAYMKKHMVKAGITGWAQVNGWRGSTDLQRRIECDLFYVENWSLGFDLKIILMTLFKGFVHKNAY